MMLLRGSSYYICFIMGIILADYDRNRVRDEKNSVLMNVVGIVSLLLGIVLGAYPPTGVPQAGIYEIIYRYIISRYNACLRVETGVHMLYVIAAALIMFGCISCRYIRRGISNRVFLYLGERSFYIYILHFPIIMSATAWTFVKVIGETQNYNFAVTVSYIVFAGLCIIMSELLKYISEKWLNKLSVQIVDFLMIKNKNIVLSLRKD